ncbi:MAG: PIG-L family deacetylase [Chloroflexi bacterium]|nr:PIG-L family deacetylase [Chloroflexota bacterium]
MNERTLLFVGAHPDDETFAVGGTLAQYAAAGVKVYYACATRGEAGTISAHRLQGYATPGDLRWAELKCAAAVLGLSDVFHLGYRDSGMPGSEDNRHPDALTSAPVEQVAGRIVKVIREVKPQVVITHDAVGGYHHPDHIASHRATVEAFRAAGDASRYPEAGPAFQPQKLYFHIFPRKLLKLVVKLMPLLGQDPRKFGRNKDIDLAAIVEVDFPVNAVVKLSKQTVETRERARACHASQGGGRPPNVNLMRMANRIFGESDRYMRGYPLPTGRKREKDLFQGVI